ncbi:lysophospholipid acyltransferase family protein [Nocardioides psychrotolerans]|uniref:lysophospholipid acyltransferase family protein n=1 Tax=Nocardioides psychrotolerans TaxID=1005945 RepID=UPI003137AC07
MKVRTMQDKRRPGFAFAVTIVKPVLLATTTHEWIDGEKLPATGGCVVVLNHVSHVDPLTAAHLVYDHGRVPHYLAKSSLFHNKVLGFLMRAAGQIPVERASSNAVGAFTAAVEAVRAGKVVVVYPEGTITRDPDLWPMTGKSGAARIALETGCPVIPVGQWGAHEILYPYASKPDLFPRKLIRMKVGDPVDLDDLVQRPRDHSVFAEATDRIMAAITGLVEDVRGATAPAERFDMRKAGIRPTGTPDPKDEQ